MPTDFRNQTADRTPVQKPLPPKGMTTARIWYVCDLGTQEGEYTDPGTKKVTSWVKPLIKLGFELPGHIMPPEDGKPSKGPYALWQEYTWSMNTKGKFGPFCQAIFGPRFEIIEEEHRGRKVRVGLLDGEDLKLNDLLDVVCKVNIIHTKSAKTGLTYANISTFSEFPEPLPDDPPRFQKPAPINTSRYFNLDEFNPEAFDQLYKWDQDKIRLSKEWEKLNSQHSAASTEDEDPYAGAPNPVGDTNGNDSDIPF